MKKTFFAFAVVGSLFLVSCGGTEGDDTNGEGTEETQDETQDEEEETGPSIVGEWKLTDFDMGMEVPEGQEEMFAEMKQQLLDNTSYEFKEDGTMTASMYVMDAVETKDGTYKMEGDKLMVSMDEEEDAIDYTLDDNTLVMMIEEGGQVMTMTFTRM